MKNMLLGKLFGYIGKRLDGHKTHIGGIGFILMGITYLIRYFFPDLAEFPEPDMEKGFTFISTGMLALGLGGKAQKMINASKGVDITDPANGGIDLTESPK